MSRLPYFIALAAIYMSLPSHSAPANDLPEGQHNTTVKWTKNPSTRGTLDIVFSCLFTIFACTWTVLHLNVPDLAKSGFGILLKQVEWMLINILCPEIILAYAVSDWLKVGQEHSDIKIFFQECLASGDDNPTAQWTIQDDKSRVKEKWANLRVYFGYDEKLKKEQNDPKLWTKTHTKYLNMGGLCLEIPDSQFPNQTTSLYNIAANHITDHTFFDPDYWPLNSLSISEKDILDKGKGDGFSKFITVAQILWLVVTIIARKIYHLPSSQLEILTLAFAVFAVFSYLAQWDKPKGINVPTRIYLQKLSDNHEKKKRIQKILKTVTKSNISNSGTGRRYYMVPIVLFGSMTLFGGLHWLAWSFTFPSTIEHIMWRVASILLISCPILFYVLAYLIMEKNSVLAAGVIGLLFIFLALLYCVARLIVIGVAFSSLRSMPAEVYYTTWSKYVPNVQ